LIPTVFLLIFYLILKIGGLRIMTFYPSRIPDPGLKKAPPPGSGSTTLKCTFQK